MAPEATGRGIGLYDALVRGEPLITVQSPGREGLHVVPAGIETRHVESALVNMGDSGQTRFVEIFNGVESRWDRIVFDLPPSVLGKRLSEVVLSSSQFLVAPCTDTPDDIEGLRSLGDLNRELETRIIWLGVALVRIAISATRRRSETLRLVGLRAARVLVVV